MSLEILSSEVPRRPSNQVPKASQLAPFDAGISGSTRRSLCMSKLLTFKGLTKAPKEISSFQLLVFATSHFQSLNAGWNVDGLLPLSSNSAPSSETVQYDTCSTAEAAPNLLSSSFHPSRNLTKTTGHLTLLRTLASLANSHWTCCPSQRFSTMCLGP